MIIAGIAVQVIITRATEDMVITFLSVNRGIAASCHLNKIIAIAEVNHLDVRNRHRVSIVTQGQAVVTVAEINLDSELVIGKDDAFVDNTRCTRQLATH